MKSRKALPRSAQLSFLHAIQSPRKVTPRPWPSPKLSLLASDEELAMLAQRGNDQAFDVLLNRYYKKLLCYARRFLYNETEYDDIIQDVFLKVYQHLSSFQPDRQFRPWIYRIAHNTFVTFAEQRRHAPIPFIAIEILPPEGEMRERPDLDYQHLELSVMLEQKISQLPMSLRSPIVLRFYEGLHYSDIAAILHVPTATVGVRIHRGLKMLRRLCRNDEM